MIIQTRHKFRLLLVLQCVLLINGCTSLIQHPSDKYLDKESQFCAGFFINLDQTISKAGVIDSETARIQNYSYLRINRFLADFRKEEMDEVFLNAWIARLQNLASEGWLIELSNLPTLEREKITPPDTTSNIKEAIRYCGDLLIATDLDETSERLHLKSIAIVPDEYKTWQRVIGLYPLTALAFRSGINSWHKEINKIYAQPLEALTIKGELLRYAPSTNNISLFSNDISKTIVTSSNNVLNIPEPSVNDLQKLFNSYAPIFEIDTVTNNDRIGAPQWDKDNLPKIKTDLPKIYQHLSYTRVSDQILLQLNYSIWFPARPKASAFDMLGGHLDGITWRVTLLADGKPWLFDTIHNCGCYHLFFPTQHATIFPQESTWDEPAFIPQTLSVNSNSRPVIRIAHGTHYIERVYFDNNASDKVIHYQQADSKILRSMERSDGTQRSLYGQDGIIASSKRGERYLFWPMGIPNPGAMRQWGHHATAFVGRRHFDDARLFEAYFGIINSNN
ncbi:MAG TPA: hypothetical protein EYQ42_06830 [Thiotrichaceae bacterium]|jgi:hypothetical protein|nr:hypothetical protein [Thiotrichaceae bacterium]